MMATIERLAVRLFVVVLLVFSFHMTWQAAYSQGRESVFDWQQIAATIDENCYGCDSNKAIKPRAKGDK